MAMKKNVNKKIINECIKIAIQNNNPDNHPEYYSFKHFSFVVQNNRILACGFNKTGPPINGFGYLKPPYGKIHSENDVYKKAHLIINKRKPFSVVNIRLIKNNEIRISKPCKCCMSFLKVVGCKEVYFSTESGFARLVL